MALRSDSERSDLARAAGAAGEIRALPDGYAVLVVDKSGARRAIVGPHTRLLEYDETLQPIELSTGTPKGDTHLLDERVHPSRE